jgi:alpha-glucosidase
VGGFAGSPQPELLTRWLQAAAFHPIDRDHTSKDTLPQEPWEDGTTEDVALRRKAIEERYRLMPYLYTTAEEMSRTGMPLMRPLFLEFPASTVEGVPIDLANANSFLLGADLLIAQSPYPDERDDYSAPLPAVGWYDYWTGAPVEGSNALKTDNNGGMSSPQVRISHSQKTLPVFVRAGAILPVQPLVQSTEERPQGPLTLRVYPPMREDGECRGSLYLDDGVSYGYQKGDFLRESFTCKKTADGLTVTVAPREGSFAPWWKQISVEVCGVGKAATALHTDDGKGFVIDLKSTPR